MVKEHRVNEGARQNFMDNSNAVGLISQDISEDVVTRGRGKYINGPERSTRFDLLTDDL